MLILALTTGIRYGELVGLSIEDLDFKNNQIKVHRQWKYKKGGGFGPLKNEQSERVISVDELTDAYFKETLKARRE